MALWYDEVTEDSVRFGLKVERTLFVGKSAFQNVAVIETTAFGRALLLDDLWMTSERDEHVYHELIAHVPLTTAHRIARVLIIGGGDGGTAREVLRHPEVEHVDLVEIDGLVIEASKQHLAMIGTAWEDPRLHVIVGDGIAWVKDPTVAPYDVVIVDGSDPVGPAVGLFNREFYEGCRDKLNDGGCFITQSESPVMLRGTHLEMVRTIGAVFGAAHPLYGPVPLYPSGAWSWTFASKGVDRFAVHAERAERVEPVAKYWNRDIHRGAFALPNDIRLALSGSTGAPAK